VRFAPPDALTSSAGVAGARLAVPVQAGAYLTAGSFAGTSDRDEYGLRRGERAVTVDVAAGFADGGPPPGSRVDVLVSTDGPGGGRTQMALAGAELLRLAEAPAAYGDPDAPTAPTALATLRVTTRQAVYLAAADNFAREIRLLIRPPGDRSRAGAAVIRGDLSAALAHEGFMPPDENPPSTMLTQLRRPARRSSQPRFRRRGAHPRAARAIQATAPEDAALYACGCGENFTAQVTAGVRCPACGAQQAW
jgi:Flp pilus assembly protein CpaB